MTKPGPVDRALLPLRAFLGVTFCFAGLQKLANHGFFDASDPASIQAQLTAAVRRSPIHVLISPLQHVAVAVGLIIALSELAIGLGTLLGLWSRIAAAGGMALSLMLFLTVSFHSSPYYTGADIVFLFAWSPLLLAPPSPWSLDAIIAARAASDIAKAKPSAPRAKPAGSSATPSPAQAARAEAARSPAQAGPSQEGQTRRETMLKATVTAAVAVGGFVLGGLTSVIGRLASGRSKDAATATLTPSTSPQSSTSPQAGASASAAGSGSGAPPGRAIGPATAVPVGSAALFTDPGSGDPAILLHPRGNTFLAFDAVCPHAGCTVQYDPNANQIVCPCHGSQFNATTGAVELGPAASGLRPISVARGPGNQLYAV